MKYDYKRKSLAKKIKEILQENFPKDKSLTDIKSALLDDHDFIIFCARKPRGLQPRGGITPSILL